MFWGWIYVWYDYGELIVINMFGNCLKWGVWYGSGWFVRGIYSNKVSGLIGVNMWLRMCRKI